MHIHAHHGAFPPHRYTNEANRDAIREAGAIPLLLGLLDQGAPKAEEDAAGALWNLTEHSSANCAALLEASGVRFLLGLILREALSSRGAAFVPLETAPEPLWRLAENALVNLVEAPPSAPVLLPTRERLRLHHAAAAASATAGGDGGARDSAGTRSEGGAQVHPAPTVAPAPSAPVGASSSGSGNGSGGGSGGGGGGGGGGGIVFGRRVPSQPHRAAPQLASWPLIAEPGGVPGGVQAGVPGGRSIRARATAEVMSQAHLLGLLERGKPPRLPPRLLEALQRQFEPQLDAAQEGEDEAVLEAALADAAALGIPARRLHEASERFHESAVAHARRTRRERLGLTDTRPPDEFRCPLTLAQMRDPVVASDGHSYERRAIEEVLRQPAPRSPLTREALRSEVVPNHALRKRIEEHESELDRTLERVAQALETRAEEQLASARAQISRLQWQLSRFPAGLADEGEDAREDASSGGGGGGGATARDACAGRVRRVSSSIGATSSPHESPARCSSKRLRGQPALVNSQPAAESASLMDPATGRDSGPVLRKRRRS